MTIYAIIYLVISGAGLLVAANQHGKEKTGTHDFMTTAIASAIVYTLLILGGFFN